MVSPRRAKSSAAQPLSGIGCLVEVEGAERLQLACGGGASREATPRCCYRDALSFDHWIIGYHGRRSVEGGGSNFDAYSLATTKAS